MLVPGGNKGVLLKSNTPFNCDHADNFGLIFEFLSKLSVNSAWGSRRSHSVIGNCGLQVARPLHKWFLNVRMAASAAFHRCWYGGANWYVPSNDLIVDCTSLGHSLSKINNCFSLCFKFNFVQHFVKASASCAPWRLFYGFYNNSCQSEVKGVAY